MKRTISSTRSGSRGETASKIQEAEEDWMEMSAALVRGWCKQLSAVAAAKPKSGTLAKPPGGAEADQLLAHGANVVASYRVSLPNEAPAGFSKAACNVLELSYVRAEESNKLKKAISYYRGQVQGRTAGTQIGRRVSGVIGETVWIDSLRPGSQKDRRRSVDVLITRPQSSRGAGESRGRDNAVKAGDDYETDLIVEVLSIEIKDPSREK
jgi:hypothetical protein